MTSLEVALDDVDFEVVGQVPGASNQTLLCRTPNGQELVYKPISGERPLWDFPRGCLAHREYASWLISRALGWDIVPATTLRMGPMGLGTLQVWVTTDQPQNAVLLVDQGHLPEGYLEVFQAQTPEGEIVSLVHADQPELFRIAIFDLLINNADRKGSHILMTRDGHSRGIDHGLSLHSQDKLRTVLWGWSGQQIPELHLADIHSLRVSLESDLEAKLLDFLDHGELEALRSRTSAILAHRRMPVWSGSWSQLPWPPL